MRPALACTILLIVGIFSIELFLVPYVDNTHQAQIILQDRPPETWDVKQGDTNELSYQYWKAHIQTGISLKEWELYKKCQV